MVRRTRGLVVGILALGAAADAQPRPAPPPSVVVLRVVQAPVLDARATLRTHLPAIARCLEEARAADPARLAPVRSIDATIALGRDGAAASVELMPPLTARGLSACLAETLLGWAMHGPTRVGAAVVLRITVPPR